MAKGLEGIINVGAVDMTTDQAAGAPYGIQGFPTIKFFGNNKQKPADYNGGRDYNSMLNYAFERARKIANARANYSGGSKNNNGQQKQQKQQQRQGKTGGGSSQSGNGKVIVLTDSNFASNVYNSKNVWMVEFYAPWCGHCKRLQPEWEAAARQVEGVNWAKVDCTVEQQICGQMGVRGYPTIKSWLPGARGASDAQDYSGGRQQADLAEYAQSLFAANMPAKEVRQMKSHADFVEYCEDNKGVCFIFFLPHILDTSEAERKAHLDMLNRVNSFIY